MSEKKRRIEDWEDDGHTIVNMNVAGMPGYRAAPPQTNYARKQGTTRSQERLSPREDRMVLFAGMKWALLFSLGIVAMLVLFILFCTRIWLA